MNSSVNRALTFQGGGSLGAYEAGAYKAIKEKLSQYRRAKGLGNESMFHIVSGTSIGAINVTATTSTAAILLLLDKVWFYNKFYNKG